MKRDETGFGDWMDEVTRQMEALSGHHPDEFLDFDFLKVFRENAEPGEAVARLMHLEGLGAPEPPNPARRWPG